MKPLYVLKCGSSTLEHGSIFAEIAELVARGARVLLVAGGARAIERHYGTLGRTMPELQLGNGDVIRYCPPQEMPHLLAAYETVALPAVEAGLRREGLSLFALPAARGRLVMGRVNRPLRAVLGKGRACVVRDHRAGAPVAVDTARLTVLLDTSDVVCLSPPISDCDGGTPLNVDADVLAAYLSNALRADHLRLVTGTAGLLTAPADRRSTLRDAHADEAAAYAVGRMRQKVRAAELALEGCADVAITGPDSLADLSGWTRFWRTREPSPDLALLSRGVGVPSVSGDERELAAYGQSWCAERGIEARIDAVGNLVAERGTGPRRLLLLGHLDTVPFHWPVEWRDGKLFGRGSVDAKGSLLSFLEVLAGTEVPADGQLRVVGAVEEEVSSAKGAFHVRDQYAADAVVIGEPSGSRTLTLGYFGLLKLRVAATVATGHSAGEGWVSAPDALFRALEAIRASVRKCSEDALSAVTDVECRSGRHRHVASAILNFRVPPKADLSALQTAALGSCGPGVAADVLRATPGVVGGRSTPLVNAFTRSFARAGVRPRYVVKKGTSDMNTLATTWRGVPMVAYGPGDSALDHSANEHIGADEYRAARAILTNAVATWFATRPQASS